MDIRHSRKALLSTIIMLAWPTILEEILQTAVSYVDSAMVGRIGAHATAAVGATATVNWLIGGSVSALSIGFLAYISREIGAKRPENVRRATMQASLTALVAGILFTVLTLSLSRKIPEWMNAGSDIIDDASTYFFILYIPMLLRAFSIIYATCLRAAGDTRTPLRVNVVMNVINIVLNFLLIYPTRDIRLFGIEFRMPGADLGVTGAAIASAASIAVSGIGMIIAVMRHDLLSPNGLSLKPDISILKPCLKVSLPCALQRFGTSLGYVAFAAMINTLGTTSIAAHSIANTVESAFYIPGWGMQTAAATLIGNCYGANDRGRMKSMCRMLIIIEILLMVCTGAMLFFGANFLMTLFTPDADVISLGTTVLMMVAVSEPIYGLAIISEGIFQGVGDTRYAFVCNIAGMWGVRILGTFICLHFFGGGLTSAWACMITHNAVLGTLLVVRCLFGHWNPLDRKDAKHGIPSGN